MTHARAIVLAIAAMQREIRALAVEANLCDQMGATYPAAVNASKRRKELQQAIEALKQPQQERMKL